ncbi:MAG: 4-phosphoerythronate dehydrogenase, partial [Planctomycetota bacterium]
MHILIDEAIWGVPTLFTPLGKVRTYTGRALTRDDLGDADALIVRSVTRVDAALLQGSRVRFVGTVSTGDDHIDRAYLSREGITFASAAGFNARTVAEYVVAVLLELAATQGFDLPLKTLGVLGVGRIGSLVARWGELLGLRVVRCDPPRQRAEGGGGFVSSECLCHEADIVSVHVPLSRAGTDATWRMIDAGWLNGMKTGAMLINTSRGDVMDEEALLTVVQGRRVNAALDVWQGEPNVCRELVEACAIATPHVAGYSMDATQRGAMMIRDALALFSGATAQESETNVDHDGSRRIDIPTGSMMDVVRFAVRSSCDVNAMDRAMRNW